MVCWFVIHTVSGKIFAWKWLFTFIILGQNAKSAMQILLDSGLNITAASDMADAAQKVVAMLPKSW